MPHKQLMLRYKAPTSGVAEQVGATINSTP